MPADERIIKNYSDLAENSATKAYFAFSTRDELPTDCLMPFTAIAIMPVMLVFHVDRLIQFTGFFN
jgi:hypothetical protein